ncbi:hypothetical protein ACFRSX_23820 [Streptomyces goshikiensis]|uniref:hypothetical protein n=1 Tax=Streptomyces TaxID=1883 RepID=UPI00131B6CD6|nr:hypothetical protein [Streptomyces sp. CB02120-2]
MSPNATPQPRRAPRATVAVRTVHLARALAALSPAIATVRTTPVYSDFSGRPRTATLVTLDDEHGRPVTADRATHRAALALLRQQFTLTDWTCQRRYDVRTGRLVPLATPFGPRELTDGAGR